MNDDQSGYLSRRITGEHVLLTGLILMSVYMFQESYSFRDPSGLFPRFIAGVTVIVALILLLRNYLPEPLKALTEESGDVFGSHEEEIKEVSQKLNDDETPVEGTAASSDAKIEETEPAASAEGDTLSVHSVLSNKRLRLTSLTTGYVALSYLIGFIWATPTFVLAYSLSVRHRWYVTAALVTVTYLLVSMFMLLLNVQLNSGVLFG